MHLTRNEIDGLDRVYRLNIINSISGIKPANLIGTKSKSGQSNVAIFSSVFHLGSNPPLLGMISRPVGEVPRHTIENILETGVYTINHVRVDDVQKAHYTSAKLDRDQSEFEVCQFTEEYIDGFDAPFVKESNIKIGMRLKEQIPIPINDTILFIGEVEHIIAPDNVVDEKGYFNLADAETAGISGLNRYYSLKYKNEFPYARPNQIPSWE